MLFHMCSRASRFYWMNRIRPALQTISFACCHLLHLIVEISSQGNVMVPKGASKVRRGLVASQMITVKSIMQNIPVTPPPKIMIEVRHFLRRLVLGPVFKTLWGAMLLLQAHSPRPCYRHEVKITNTLITTSFWAFLTICMQIYQDQRLTDS